MRLVLLMLVGLGALGLARAWATPAVTMDVATGDVLYQEDAAQPWFPASTTKLMTIYVALAAVRDHKIAMDTPLVVSARAHKMPPARMGFPVGTQVTLGNAMKMLMVHSPNDIAVTIAEGVAGSVEAFADEMNKAAARLGMRDSHFANPNGLPAQDHYVSARDMAILARAIYLQFPEEASLFDIRALSLGKQVIENTNTLLGRYPGMDGMKTGYLCESGWNLVASATRGGRHVLSIVFGGPTEDLRNEKVVALLNRAFDGVDRPSGSIAAIPAWTGGRPPDIHDEVCGKDGALVTQFTDEIATLDAPVAVTGAGTEGQAPPGGAAAAASIVALPLPPVTPIPVRVGADPGYVGVVAQARAANTPIGTATAPIYGAVTPANAKAAHGRRKRTGRISGAHAPAGKAATEKAKKSDASN